MEYISTRGGDRTDFSGTVLAGLARDKGLFVPSEFYKFDPKNLAGVAKCGYVSLAYAILAKLAEGMDNGLLFNAIENAYTKEKFSNTAQHAPSDSVVPVHEIMSGLWLLELYRGPTLAFKDVGMQLLAGLFDIVLEGKPLNIVGATSGDTGSAAMEALFRYKNINVFMMSPALGMSPIQQGQMWGMCKSNIHNLVIDGSFDECQAIAKSIMGELDFRDEYHLGMINSVNWGRVAAQVVYYFWAHQKACPDLGPVDFTVPTGNFGNIYAAYVAKKMGVPIRRLVLATNQNDVLHQFFETGIYAPRSEVVTTASPSMDIQSASNFERYIFDICGGDAKRVISLWNQVASEGSFDLSDKKREIEASGMVSCAVSEKQCLIAISDTYAQTGKIIDPHTAIAMFASRKYRDSGVPMVVVGTADAAKFPDTIQKAIGKKPPMPKVLEGVASLSHHVTRMKPDANLVKEFIAANIDP